MILLIRRKWVLGAAALLLAVVSLLSLAERPRAAIPAFSYDALPTREVVIIDAGHGGSDGGAVSTDGTPESGINLAVALRLRDFLALTGCQTVLTRTGEASLADPNSGTLRKEKVSDTKNRVTRNQQRCQWLSHQHPSKYPAGASERTRCTGVLRKTSR